MWGGAVTIPLANTNYSLETLFTNLAATDQPPLMTIRRCQMIDFQTSSTLGGGIVRIGGRTLSDTMMWKYLYATQSWVVYSMESNLITVNEIYVRCDVAGTTLNVFMISR